MQYLSEEESQGTQPHQPGPCKLPLTRVRSATEDDPTAQDVCEAATVVKATTDVENSCIHSQSPS